MQGQRFIHLIISQPYIYNALVTSTPVQQTDKTGKKKGGKDKYVYLWTILFCIISKIFCHRTLESQTVKSLKRATFLVEKAMTMKGRFTPHAPVLSNISFSQIFVIFI